MKHIVVIGGGFGGVYLSRYLLKDKSNRVTLISDKNYLLFTPLLHEVATGAQNRNNVIISIRSLFHERNFTFYRSKVKKIDFNKKTIYCLHHNIKYDKVIIAIGAKTNFYSIENAEDYTVKLKTVEDAIKLRKKVIYSLEKASIKEDEKLLTFVVVGGGPTGVELAGELSEFIGQNLTRYPIKKEKIKIYLIQKGNKIMPILLHDRCIEKAMKRLERLNIEVILNSSVTKIEKDFIELNNKDKIHTRNVFWTAGITPNKIETIPKVTNDNGFYEINEYLEVKDTKDVYAIGDCALSFNPNSKKPNPPLAQLATKQAKHLAKHIIDSKNKKPFIFRPSGFLVSIGQWWAIAEISGRLVKGKIAWWLWRTVYLMKTPKLKNKVRIAIDWTINLFSKRDLEEI